MRQILVLFTLVLLMQVVIHHGVTSNAAFDSLTLLTTGFILVGGYSMGELFRRLRLPALLGYLAAGIVFGPKLIGLSLGDPTLAPIGAGSIAELGLVNVLAVGVIGTMGGGEIKLPELRENIGKLAAICAAVFVLVLPLVGGVVLALSFLAPSVVPFLAELPLAGRIAGALLFGALAVGMSPAATLALMQEVHARGKFTSLVLGVVVLGDLILVATFLLVLALAKLLISPEGLSLASLAEQLPHIAGEFGWALGLGVAVGLVFILYLRFVGREILLFSLAIVFVTAFAAARLHAETLLAFLIAGFVVQNFSRHGHALIEAFERIALPVFVIYFTAQAANLDLVAVTRYLPLTLVLVGLRSTLFVLGVGLGARTAGVDDGLRKRLQVAFFSQGGVDLVLAAMVAAAIPGWGAEVQTVTMATILFYVVVGPPLLARALDSVGESAAARERGAEQLAADQRERSTALDAESQTEELVAPRTEDPALDRRLAELLEVVSTAREELIERGVLARAHRRRDSIAPLAASIRASIDVEHLDRAQAEQARAELDRHVAEFTLPLARAELVPYDERSLADLFETLERAQEFGESFRVIRSAGLFEDRGGRLARALRGLRRVRRRLAGPGYRSVALGRLWRFHMSLAVPVAIWRTTRPTDAAIWNAVFQHHRLTRAQLDTIVDGSWATAQRDGSPRELAAWLADARTQARAREQAVCEQLDASVRALELGFGRGLALAWRDFVDSVELAGTLERPAWRTRPSRRHDAARAAIAELLESSARDREAAWGRVDALASLAHAEQLACSVRKVAREFEADATRGLAQLDDALAGLAGADASEPVPALRRMAEQIAGLRREVGALAEAELAPIRRELDEIPESLAPSRVLGLEDELDPQRVGVRLRAWLAQTLVREFQISLVAATDELGVGLDGVREGVEQLARIVDYHLRHAASESPSGDRGFDERLLGLLERSRAQVRDLARLAASRAEDAVAGAERVGLEPIRARRFDELERRLRRLDEPPRFAIAQWLRARVSELDGELRTRLRGLVDELGATFGDDSPAARLAWRRALFGPRSTMPESYQRLFTSVAAETVGLLVPRSESATLERAAERWLETRTGALLIHGDRGVGKRTLVRQLLAQLGDRVEVGWLRLTPGFERAPELLPELGPWLALDDDAASDFADACERLAGSPPSADERPRVIVVENAERLFRRTADGLAQIRGFLDLVAASDQRALWIVIMAEPAVVMLDAAIELRARFSTAVGVPAMTAEQISAVLELRHRLSGYALRFEVGAAAWSEWLRDPLSRSRPWQTREQAVYSRLARLCEGNVRQAMRLWLTAAHTDPGDPAVVVLASLPGHTARLLEQLPVSSRLLLAALLLHGPLARHDLLDLDDRDAVSLDAELTRLAQLGLVRFDEAKLVGVDTRLVQPLTAELRACNLL